MHDPMTRSRNMAAIRGADTRPELMIRRALHALGFRFRLQDRKLPGRPDLVLARYRAVIFVQGCFWHLHGCDLFRWPATRQEFWQGKLRGNQARDQRNIALLTGQGWRVAQIWECALKGRQKLAPGQVVAALADWLRSDAPLLDISGQG
ncbi:very short patch repair endonuclease [Pseudogemmobacter faecipullorum]|uniref:very short patch repair endonuclease n=1 Tax=Pseudogemmobacter faecipullorum TaxID=2755041 RepID=UPI00338D4EA5